MGKYSFEEAKRDFLNKGFILDEPEEKIINLKNLKERLNCHCKIHNTFKETSWSNIKAGRCGCNDCRKERGRTDLTDEEKIKIFEDNGFEYVSGDLRKILNPVLIKCKKNNHKFYRSLNNIKRGSTDCPYCNGKILSKDLTPEFCQKFLDDNMHGYKIVKIDKNSTGTRLFLKCPNKLHKEYWASWGHIYREQTMCRECYYDKHNKINWNAYNIDNILEQYGFKIKNRDDYKSSHERFAAYDEFGFIYMVSIHYLVMHRTSFSLWKNNPYAVQNIKLFCKLYRPDYEFVSEQYKGNKKIHKFKYIGKDLPKDIDPIFEIKFGDFVNCWCGHPRLSKSVLESTCSKILDDLKIKYITQKTFSDCRDKGLLRFDFYFKIGNKEICIETDGKQHTHPVPRWGGLEHLKDIQRKDKIKNDYCKTHDIVLIRIPYNRMEDMKTIIESTVKLYTNKAS